jgi:valyl-tRNA synthetase
MMEGAAVASDESSEITEMDFGEEESSEFETFAATESKDAFEAGKVYMAKLAYALAVEVSGEVPENSDKMVSVITDNAKLYMPLTELVDVEKELARLNKELANAEKQLDAQNGKLANVNFVTRAPETVVNIEREKKAKLEALIVNLKASIANLNV